MTSGSPRVLRTLNERAALELLLGDGPLTRGELESRTGLSKAAAAEVLRRLESAGLVRKGGRKSGSVGPAAQMWALDGSAGHVAGVDVTSFRLDVAVADLAGRPIAEHRIATDGEIDPVTTLAGALHAAAGKAGLAAADLDQIVVGMPGIVDSGAGDRLDTVSGLPHRRRVHDLAPLRELLGNPRIRVENDVNLVALEEQAAGAARGADTFALLWLGQGLGSGIVLNGRLWRGASGRGGEVGSILAPDGRPLGSLLGAGAVNDLAHAWGAARVPGAPEETRAAVRMPGGASESWDATEAAARALASGHPALLDEVAARLAVAVSGLVAVLDPGLVVLGGPLLRAGGQALHQRVADRVADVEARTVLLPSAVGGNAVRAGAVEFALSLARERVFHAGTAGRHR
ncbi:ROK family transcriptional regulator [Nonomuraea sp. NPDC003804]|uniref:ROK family transcriptional regulator n=1 Tax=Nonomuraea sp. NPDC003804 TaxID=3154547 RepID=UPI0033A59D32